MLEHVTLVLVFRLEPVRTRQNTPRAEARTHTHTHTHTHELLGGSGGNNTQKPSSCVLVESSQIPHPVPYCTNYSANRCLNHSTKSTEYH